jgi:hypothetical protein
LRGDRRVWRRQWSEPTRLVIEYLDICVVEAADDGTVTFDREISAEMQQHLLFDHVLPLVLSRRGGVVLHGAVISREGRGVVLVGTSGAGKSTLTAFAWQQGWTVGGDDGALVEVRATTTVEPTYATVRLTPDAMDLIGLDAVDTAAVVGKRRVFDEAGRRFSQERVQLRTIAFIEPVGAGAPAELTPITGAHAHAKLFGATFHPELSGSARLPGVMRTLASVVESTTVARLSVPRGVHGLAAAERLLTKSLLLADPTDVHGAEIPR